jgi:hypothetical protein
MLKAKKLLKKTKLKQKPKQKSNEWYRKECVKVAKKIVHIRDNDICQKCGKPGNALHCSHVYPEGTYHGMSANPLNMKLLCYYCHYFWWHKNPLEAKDWFVKTFPDRYKKLKILSRQTLQHDYKKMLLSLREELKNYEK